MPFFSIVTITKNNLIGFNKTKKSINSQTYHDFELVVIDGDIEPDNGIYDAMNKGLSRAMGRYVVFMNAGDVFADAGALQTVFEQHNDADIVYGDAIEGVYFKKSKPHTTIAQGLFTHHQSIYYKRSAIKGLGYEEAYPIAADYKFTAHLLLNGATAHYVPEPLSVFDMGGVSQINAKQGRMEQIKIRQELGLKSPFTPYRQWVGHIIKKCSKRLFWRIKQWVG